MLKLFIVLLIFSLISCDSSECGCKPQKLLKRDVKSLRIGDMILDQTDIALLKGFKIHDSGTKKWPDGQVYYSFFGNFPQNKISMVKESLSELERDLGGCIKFKESKEAHFILFTSYQLGCFSHLGKSDENHQQLNLENPGCFSKGTIKHEVIHALGFMHTHMRKDRDQHITIKWPQIMNEYCSQFHACHGCELDGPYETSSIMHYPSYGFSCLPGVNVILRKDGGIIHDNQQTTQNDLDMIKRFYQC